MRRFVLFLLVLQLFAGNMPGSELMKLPFLVRHFSLHQRVRPDASWLDYLRLHYANAKHRNADPEHRQLPLHTSAAPAGMVMLFPAALDTTLCKPVEAWYSGMPIDNERLLPLDYRERLLRPPRA